MMNWERHRDYCEKDLEEFVKERATSYNIANHLENYGLPNAIGCWSPIIRLHDDYLEIFSYYMVK